MNEFGIINPSIKHIKIGMNVKAEIDEKTGLPKITTYPYCDKCGKLFKEEIPNFCEECGNPLENLKNKIKKRCICDDLIEKGENIPDYCPECGKPLKKSDGGLV